MLPSAEGTVAGLDISVDRYHAVIILKVFREMVVF
jgi:hypothetical protein